MAKKDQGTENPFDFGLDNLDIKDTISKSERFLEQYKNLLYGGLVGLIVVIGLVYYINGIHLPNRQAEAQNLMYVAERYFENDSMSLAVNGDGNFPGFEEIADDYSWTRAGKLARYYAGVSYLRMGQYEEAISQLKKFSTKEPVVSSMALGATADAYMELEEMEKAMDYYIRAADKSPNNFTSPIYLMRAGEVAEALGNKKKALALYERVRADYKATAEGQAAEKYIARVTASK